LVSVTPNTDNCISNKKVTAGLIIDIQFVIRVCLVAEGHLCRSCSKLSYILKPTQTSCGPPNLIISLNISTVIQQKQISSHVSCTCLSRLTRDHNTVDKKCH